MERKFEQSAETQIQGDKADNKKETFTHKQHGLLANTHKKRWMSIILFIVIIGIACGLFIGLKALTPQAKREREMLSRKLPANQRTNGLAIFTIPEGFTCQKQDASKDLGDDIVFKLKHNAVGSLGIYAFYTSDDFKTRVYKNLEKLTLESLKDKSPQLVAEGRENINGNTCVFRVWRFQKEGKILYWRFCSVTDKRKEKVCVINAYDNGTSGSYIIDLVKSIRFE